MPAPPAALPLGAAPGLGFSLATHAALVAAVVGGPRAAGPAPGPAEPAEVRETLHWVGLDGAGGRGAPPRVVRPLDARAPLAYFVPGAAGGPGGERAGRGLGRGGAGRTTGPTPPAPAPARPGTVPAAGPAAVPAAARLAVARVTVPLVAVPEAEVARLVAGVVAAARDQARRDARPEDFVPTLPPGALTQVGALASAAPYVPHGPLPIPFAGNPAPEYPAGLARDGVGGRVVVEFVIDSAGLVEAGSLRVLESGGPAFADAVRRVLPRLRFVPGRLGERAVGVTVRQPFLFVARRGA